MAGPTLYSYLVDAPVAIFASDVAGEEPALAAQGLMLSLLGTADAATLRRWFARLAKGGEVVDDLQERPWGACDGQVIDRYGLHWLIGFEDDASAPNR
jgi:PhnB protein